MSLSPEEVRHVALLSRLHLSDAEVNAYTEQLGKILGYVEKLKELDPRAGEPMITAPSSGNVFRADEPKSSLKREDALAAAPAHDGEYFRVPPVIE